jgi:hypothetical protein
MKTTLCAIAFLMGAMTALPPGWIYPCSPYPCPDRDRPKPNPPTVIQVTSFEGLRLW